MFEKATRLKVRFNYRGICSVEDLWDLSLTGLDTIYKNLNAEVKAQEGESLLTTKSKENELLGLKIEIVKHIFEVKQKERKLREEAIERAEMKQKLLGIKAEKEDEELRSMPKEELDKRIAELD